MAIVFHVSMSTVFLETFWRNFIDSQELAICLNLKAVLPCMEVEKVAETASLSSNPLFYLK